MQKTSCIRVGGVFCTCVFVYVCVCMCVFMRVCVCVCVSLGARARLRKYVTAVCGVLVTVATRRPGESSTTLK